MTVRSLGKYPWWPVLIPKHLPGSWRSCRFLCVSLAHQSPVFYSPSSQPQVQVNQIEKLAKCRLCLTSSEVSPWVLCTEPSGVRLKPLGFESLTLSNKDPSEQFALSISPVPLTHTLICALWQNVLNVSKFFAAKGSLLVLPVSPLLTPLPLLRDSVKSLHAARSSHSLTRVTLLRPFNHLLKHPGQHTSLYFWTSVHLESYGLCLKIKKKK